MADSFTRWLKNVRPGHFVVISILAALVLTAISNSIIMLLMQGTISPIIFWLGELDALVVSAIIAPIIISRVRRAMNLEDINQGLKFEIAERQRAETALRRSEDRWRTYIEEANDLIFALGADGKITMVNRAVCRTLGYMVPDLVGRDPLDFVVPESQAEARAMMERILRDASLDPILMEMLTRDGRRVSLEVRGSTFRDGEVVTGSFHIARDVTERRQAVLRLEYLGTHDALTDLYNRAFFEEELKRLEHSRYFPVSIVMCDVNGLKTTNDQQGHAAGDDLLRGAANVLTDAFRGDDIVARIGGDEFAVLLPNTCVVVAQRMLARVRQSLARHNAEVTLPLSLALGAATGERSGTLLNVLREADAQMYRDKHGAN